MSETIKFTEEEIKTIKELRENSQAKVVEFGQLKLDVFLTNQRLSALNVQEEALEKEYTNLQAEETKIVQELKDKYGVGTVDIASGEFIPAK